MQDNDKDPLYLSIDVGTGSARAALFTSKGQQVGQTVACSIKTFRPIGRPLLYQQSTEDIWRAVCRAVHGAVASAGGKAARERVVALAFDATCSLVVLGEKDRPLSVTPAGTTTIPAETGDEVANIILWLDHRAVNEAAEINALPAAQARLRYVGSNLSPENEIPKLLWLKRHLKERVWRTTNTPSKTRHGVSCVEPDVKFFDLADYLSYRASGSYMRSSCCVVSKWLYVQEEGKKGEWDRPFLEAIDLGDMTEEQLGKHILRPGDDIAALTSAAGKDLDLQYLTRVATGTVDAFAGAIGSLGGGDKNVPMEARLALICGTSTCHLTCSPTPVFCPNVWGPFYDVLGTELWVSEGGISASGKLLDYLIETHPAYPELQTKAAAATQHPQAFLHTLLRSLAADASHLFVALLTPDLHVSPDFAGNRSPVGDPDLKGSITGLTLDASLSSLALLYLATLQALALATKHILDALLAAGHPPITHLYISGGLGLKNDLFCQVHADVTGCVLVLPPEQTEGVLLGTAMVAATAAGTFKSVAHAMEGMAPPQGRWVTPTTDERVRAFYRGKERVYHALREGQQSFRAWMKEAMP